MISFLEHVSARRAFRSARAGLECSSGPASIHRYQLLASEKQLPEPFLIGQEIAVLSGFLPVQVLFKVPVPADLGAGAQVSLPVLATVVPVFPELGFLAGINGKVENVLFR